jgi:hypothetical protein
MDLEAADGAPFLINFNRNAGGVHLIRHKFAIRGSNKTTSRPDTTIIN